MCSLAKPVTRMMCYDARTPHRGEQIKFEIFVFQDIVKIRSVSRNVCG
jgi:hypothetical protein